MYTDVIRGVVMMYIILQYIFSPHANQNGIRLPALVAHGRIRMIWHNNMFVHVHCSLPAMCRTRIYVEFLIHKLWSIN